LAFVTARRFTMNSPAQGAARSVEVTASDASAVTASSISAAPIADRANGRFSRFVSGDDAKFDDNDNDNKDGDGDIPDADVADEDDEDAGGRDRRSEVSEFVRSRGTPDGRAAISVGGGALLIGLRPGDAK
jgi:hypothetical protein